MVSTAGCCHVLLWKRAALDCGSGSAGVVRSAHRCQTDLHSLSFLATKITSVSLPEVHLAHT